jgi:opacity protein-like surface antigen
MPSAYCGARRSPRLGSLAALLALALMPASVSAQLSTTRGWSFGTHLQGTSLTVEEGAANSGSGLGIRVGYGFNRIVTGFLHADGARIEVPGGEQIVGEWNLAHAELGARFHFANSLRRWVPYLETSIGARAVSVDNPRVDGQSVETLRFNGNAFTVGGGVSTFVRKTLAVDVSLNFTGGRFTEVEVGDITARTLDVDASSARFGLGVIWWP